ncbi:MAG TPA: hypothetical protein VNK67_02485 [Burkholderiales bacterium]|nr:hypothetical protein [Burkholderiales bacterium]
MLDYYKYAALATASYVRVGNRVTTADPAVSGRVFADAARDQGRLPLVLGEKLFVQSAANPDVWAIKHYYGGDVPGVVDNTGFAATLFERGGEKVLAIRGTEPGSDRAVDLFQADLGAIGILGMSLPQAVSMINLIQRLKAGAGTPVLQLRVQTSLTQPSSPHV